MLEHARQLSRVHVHMCNCPQLCMEQTLAAPSYDLQFPASEGRELHGD